MDEKVAINIYKAKAIINAIITKQVSDRALVERLRKIDDKLTYVEEIASSNEEIEGDIDKLFNDLVDVIIELLVDLVDIPIVAQILLDLREQVRELHPGS